MLKPIADGVWSQENDVALPGGMSMPSRATVLRLADGALAVHSPLALDQATAEEIASLGEVALLIAPSTYHWMFVEAAKRRFPGARVLAPEGLAQKIPGLAFERLPARGTIDGGPGLRVERIEGAPAIDEHAFLHEPSRTLLVSDLVFNVHDCRSFGMRCVLWAVGAWKKPAQSRMWRFLVKDRAAAARSASALLEWDVDRIVMAHGDVIDTDVRDEARRSLAWMTSVSAA